MKLKLIISFIFVYLFALSSLNAQHAIQYQAEYLLTYQQDSTDVDSKKTEIMILQLADSASLFFSQNGYIRDSLKNHMIDSGGGIERISLITKSPKTRFTEKIYKDYTRNLLTIADKILLDEYVYEEPLKGIHWNIEQEQKEVAGMHCQKATAEYKGRHWTAWFTNTLPIAEGPYKFYGLPGLIVKITDDKNHYDYTLQRLYKVEGNTMLKKPQDAMQVSRSEYKKIKSEFDKNPMQKLEQLGFTVQAKDQSKVRKRLSKRNNVIEIE